MINTALRLYVFSRNSKLRVIEQETQQANRNVIELEKSLVTQVVIHVL